MHKRIFYTCFFVLGLLLLHLSSSNSILCLLALALVGVWYKPFHKASVVLGVLIAFSLGTLRVHLDKQLSTRHKLGRSINVSGTILESPRRWGKSSVFFFSVHEVDGKILSKRIKVLVRWSRCNQWLEPGDQWSLSGRYSKGERASYPGAFDQRNWLWSQRAEGVLQINRFSNFQFLRPPEGWSLYQLSYRARAYMMRNLGLIQDEEARALVAGVVFGETQSLPKNLQDDFRRTGTSHLLAASGMNVCLLAGIIVLLGRWLGLGPWRVAPLALPLVIAYAFLAGCAPSITRAAAGTSLALIASFLGRKSDPWNTLCLSIVMLLLWEPRQIFDLGFQLSAAAVVALLAGPAPPKKLKFLSESLVLTLSATVFTLPIFWYAFGEVSVTVLLANLILGPIVELLFPLGLLYTTLPFWPLAWLNESIARLSLYLVKQLSQLADPLLLSKPDLFSWLCLLTAILCWTHQLHWPRRLVALPLIALAFYHNYLAGQEPHCEPGQIIIRRIGVSKPTFWLSNSSEEVLVLTESWQRKRACTMLRNLGCLRNPRIIILDKGERFDFSLEAFRWKSIEPLLPGAPYLEIAVRDSRYLVKEWWP